LGSFASAPQLTVILKTSARLAMTDRRAFAASLQGVDRTQMLMIFMMGNDIKPFAG